jgi:hypothetical protein
MTMRVRDLPYAYTARKINGERLEPGIGCVTTGRECGYGGVDIAETWLRSLSWIGVLNCQEPLRYRVNG